MAAATNHHSSALAGGDRQPVAARGVSSPWTQIVRGGGSESDSVAVAASSASSSATAAVIGGFREEERQSASESPAKEVGAAAEPVVLAASEESAVEAQPERTDNSNGNGNAGKKSAWNKPSNGGADGGPVMGAFSWPALAESARGSPKSSSSDLQKALSDGSASASQGTGIGTASSSSSSSSSQKQTIANNANPVPTQNHATPMPRHKRRGGGGGGNVSANGGFHHPPPLTLGSVVEMSTNNAGKPGSSDPTHKESGQAGGFGSQSHSGNDHGQHRNSSFRRGNGGSHPRGDGHYHHNYGGRDRGNHDWNPNRSFNGRDAHLQPHRGFPRGAFIRPPPPIMPPQLPVRPFATPMMYPPEMGSPMIYFPSPHPDSIRGLHYAPPMPQHFYMPPDPQLKTDILNQIDYYFSKDNLIKDIFLRQQMDDQGWVPVKLIAGFGRSKVISLLFEGCKHSDGLQKLYHCSVADIVLHVKQLTENIQFMEDIHFILDVVRSSTVVEVQGDKVRSRNWRFWVTRPVQSSNVSSPESHGSSSHDIMSANVENLSLEEKINKHSHDEAVLSKSSSGDLNKSQQSSAAGETGLATFQAGESSISVKSSSR